MSLSDLYTGYVININNIYIIYNFRRIHYHEKAMVTFGVN